MRSPAKLLSPAAAAALAALAPAVAAQGGEPPELGEAPTDDGAPAAEESEFGSLVPS